MPTIDVSNDYAVFDNTQPIIIRNPNGEQKPASHALQQGIDSVLSDSGDGTLAYRTFCTWHVWRKNLNFSSPVFVPQLNCRITDNRGVRWFGSSVNLDVWGEKYSIECEAQAGTVVQGVDLPGLG